MLAMTGIRNASSELRRLLSFGVILGVKLSKEEWMSKQKPKEGTIA